MYNIIAVFTVSEVSRLPDHVIMTAWLSIFSLYSYRMMRTQHTPVITVVLGRWTLMDIYDGLVVPGSKSLSLCLFRHKCRTTYLLASANDMLDGIVKSA